ncbi:MAG: hypothetical protein SF339_02140 [Blastocatellia bacterium]|nr:hypothetical protein [Blastocatellia bacterium]
MKTPIEILDEQIENETDPRRLKILIERREQLLKSQADEPTGNPEEDALWRRRNAPARTWKPAPRSRMNH